MLHPLTHLPCIAALAVACAALPAQVYVDAAATGANDGSSWTDAYTGLQAALQATTAGEIWVAAGTYYAGAANDQAATFQLESGVAIYGGFAGNETALGQRDIAANVVTLSGDIDQNDTYGSGTQWWYTNWNGNAGNSWHIVTGSGADASAVLDGVTIFAGRAGDPGLYGGGGLYVDGGSPTLRDCTIRYCAIGYGSSAYLKDCNSIFERCVIRDGYTCNCGAGGWVSGALIGGASNVTFVDCAFVNHYYVSASLQGRGAALRVEFGCACSLSGCRFEGNQTGNFYPMGGGTAQGAGINSGGTLVVDRCEFVDNFAHAGAGISSSGPLTLTNSLFARNRAVPHPETPSITYGDYGAALLLWGYSAMPITVANCTFVDNYCDKGAGICNYGAALPVVSNCIVYHNRGPGPSPGNPPTFLLKRQIVGSLDLSNCCIESLLQTEPNEDPPQAANFPGCFDIDPRIASVAGHDYHLLVDSPCLNSGLDAAVPGGIVTDLEGNARIVGHVDMGCYESTLAAEPALWSQNLVQDVTADFTVVNAAPGEPVFFLYNFAGLGNGPCLPAPATLCTALRSPIGVLAWVAADGDGVARVGWHVPQAAPLITLHFQAVMIRGVNAVDSVGTNTLSWTINAAP